VLGGTSGNGIATDPGTANIFVTGSFSGTVDFGGGAIGTSGNGGFFIAAYNSSGNYLWAKAYGASGDAGMGVSVDQSGNVAITGQSQTALNFGSSWLFGSGNIVANFTTAGAFRWADRANTTSCGYGAAFDSNGHLLITGDFRATLATGGISTTARGYQDGFIAHYTE